MKRKDRKTLLNEKLPDPRSATADAAAGDPRGRTAAHLKRIVAASLAAPLVASVTSCGSYRVVDPAPPPAVVPLAVGTLKVKAPMLVAIDADAPQLFAADAIVSFQSGFHIFQLIGSSDAATFAIEIGVERNAPRTAVVPLPPSGVFKALAAANIQLDGKPAIRVAPQDTVELSSGTHTIEISPTPASRTYSFTLEVRTGTASPQNRGQ
jgi:hypothetical protein